MTSEKMKQAVADLYDLPHYTSKNPMDHTRELLRRLGDPQDTFAIIHIAGSNGKGSTASFLFSMFRAAGICAGLFTSPHLCDIRERFMTTEGMCTEKEFLLAYEQVLEVAGQMQKEGESYPTFFEMIFAVGMLIFKDKQVPVVIMEAGMGGLSDTTNVIKKPVVSVITSISLEHTEYLGDTIEQIAHQKAGIIREDTPVVYDACNSKAALVVAETAASKHAKACPVSRDGIRVDQWNETGIVFTMNLPPEAAGTWRIPFVAEYQTVNAGLAITAFSVFAQEAADLFGSLMDEKDEPLTTGDGQSEVRFKEHSRLSKLIQEGLSGAKWPGRMQEIRKDIFFDGAHNEGGIREFVQTVNHLCKADTMPPILLYSMVKEKDHAACIRSLSTVSWEKIIISRVEGERGMSPAELSKRFPEAFASRIEVFEDAKAAYEHCLAIKKDGQKLFATGSLYFIGALMEMFFVPR